MPFIEKSSYRPPFWLPGGHLQTLIPALFRKQPHVTQQRERLELADGDFLDLEWSSRGSSRLAILSHGLEADTRAEYIQGMAAALIHHGWDALAWNFRGCGSTPNRKLRMYHSGATDDLDAVVRHALKVHPARTVDLIGFSLGGNLTLKYLGEAPASLPPRLHRAVSFSVPCDLACSSQQLARRSNWIYMERFLQKMRAKIRTKDRMFPGQLDLHGLDEMRSFAEFDDRFTAPIHGFLNAQDYWNRNSCRQFLTSIRHPSLLVNAANDPFLGPACHPLAEAKASPYFHFEAPESGGHVGFPSIHSGPYNWAESRALAFLSQDF